MLDTLHIYNRLPLVCILLSGVMVRKDRIVNKMEEIDSPPDGGWGWIVCLTSFWTNGTIFGILNTFGILFVELLREFDDDGDIAFKTCRCIFL